MPGDYSRFQEKKMRDMTVSLACDTVRNPITAKHCERVPNVIVINHVLLK